jgi:hypothetical protein
VTRVYRNISLIELFRVNFKNERIEPLGACLGLLNSRANTLRVMSNFKKNTHFTPLHPIIFRNSSFGLSFGGSPTLLVASSSSPRKRHMGLS